LIDDWGSCSATLGKLIYFDQVFLNLIDMKKIIVIAGLTLAAHNLFAWGQNGHRIVAQICYDNLSKKAKNEIDRILGDNYLAQIANWPDFIRSEKNWKFTEAWHYTTINANQNMDSVIIKGKSNPDIENVIEAIELMKGILTGNATDSIKFQRMMDANKVTPLNGSMKLTALAFLIHFIGDIHQPMHVGKNGDLGGNKISVMFFSKITNLHSIWDEGMIEQQQLSFSEYAGFIEKHTAPQKAVWQKATIGIWTKESTDLRELIYNTLYDNTDKDSGLPSMSYVYLHYFMPAIENRLGAAGYRAAEMLNSIF
jgi:hypothetical protein